MHPSEMVLGDPSIQRYLHETDPAWSVIFDSIGVTATRSLLYETNETLIVFRVHMTTAEISKWTFLKRPHGMKLPYTKHTIQPGLVCEVEFHSLPMSENKRVTKL